MDSMKRFDREKAEMFRRKADSLGIYRSGEHNPFDVLYEIIKQGYPELRGSEDVRKTYSKPR